MDDLLYRYTANEDRIVQLDRSPELEPLMQSVRAGMHAMDANGANVAGFHITHWRTDPGSVDYYLSHDGDYLSYNSVCLHEVGSAEAWEATERNFLQLCELTANMDLGWNPGTVAPPPPWFAHRPLPQFFCQT